MIPGVSGSSPAPAGPEGTSRCRRNRRHSSRQAWASVAHGSPRTRRSTGRHPSASFRPSGSRNADRSIDSRARCFPCLYQYGPKRAPARGTRNENRSPRKPVKLCPVRRYLSVLIALALLFSQLALAAYACPMAPPVAVVSHGGPMDCCDGMPSPLCGAHCAQGAQAQDRVQSGSPVAPFHAVIASRGPIFVVVAHSPPYPRPARSVRPPGLAPDLLYSRLRI